MQRDAVRSRKAVQDRSKVQTLPEMASTESHNRGPPVPQPFFDGLRSINGTSQLRLDPPLEPKGGPVAESKAASTAPFQFNKPTMVQLAPEKIPKFSPLTASNVCINIPMLCTLNLLVYTGRRPLYR